MKPIIGLRYEPQYKFLRQMPRDWILEEARPSLRWQWWRSGDAWVAITVGCVFLWAVIQTVRAL